MTKRPRKRLPKIDIAGIPFSGEELCEKRVREELASGVPLLVAYGGGVNSAAVVCGLLTIKLRPDFIVFADTGDEKDGRGGHCDAHDDSETCARCNTYESVRQVSQFLAQRGFPPITVIRRQSQRVPDTRLYEQCVRLETLPSRAFGMSSCAIRWKVEPQDKFYNNHPRTRACWKSKRKPIKILGYDGGETRRATIYEDDKYRLWYPLIEWDLDREDCEETIRRFGLDVPPKSACFYCPSSTKSEVLQLARERPDLMQQALAMEDQALTTEKHDLRTVRGLGRHWSWRELLEAAQEERDKMAEAPVEACIICNDGACE